MKRQMIYGRHPVVDALKAGQDFEKIYLQQGVRGPFEKELRQFCKLRNIPLQVIPKERLNRHTGKNHQGVVGYLALLSYQRLEEVIPTVYDKGELPLLVVLDGVTDVRNLGAIARSAEATGAHALILPNKGSAQINAETFKASAGALHTLPVCRTHSLVQTCKTLHENGIQIFGAALEGSAPIYTLDWTGPTALVMGDEHDGIHPSIQRELTAQFHLPMRGQTDSFNVSVAAGISLYEVLRQRSI